MRRKLFQSSLLDPEHFFIVNRLSERGNAQRAVLSNSYDAVYWWDARYQSHFLDQRDGFEVALSPCESELSPADAPSPPGLPLSTC